MNSSALAGSWVVLALATLFLVVTNDYASIIVALVAWAGGCMTPRMTVLAFEDLRPHRS